jgi:predicted nucleic acid-binding protein
MSKNSILLDASVVLELFLNRSKYDTVQVTLIPYITKCLTPITVGILFYYAEKEKLSMNRAEAFVRNCEVLTIGQSTYDLAEKIYNQNDLEDALQIASALEHNIHCVITLDNAMFKKYHQIISMVKV